MEKKIFSFSVTLEHHFTTFLHRYTMGQKCENASEFDYSSF